MRKFATLFSLIALLVLPHLTQAQLLQDADRIIMRLRVVCNYGQGGPLVVALDLFPRINGSERRIGGYNVVLAYNSGKLVMQGVQQRYAAQYWPGGQYYLNRVSGQGTGTWYNQHSNRGSVGSALPMTEQNNYFTPALDCASNPLNDGYYELLRYQFNIQASANGQVNLALDGWQPWRGANTFLTANEVTATYYSDLSNNSNDSLFNLIGVTVPVELSSFVTDALPDGSVEIKWTTQTETNNYGFEIQRNTGEGFKPITFVPGNGTVTSSKDYSYRDNAAFLNIQDGSVILYRIRQIDHDGSDSYSQTNSVTIAPQSIQLGDAYPNPAVVSTSMQIPYSLSVPAAVTLNVYNALGERVASIVSNDAMNAGNYRAVWHGTHDNGSYLSAGVYYVHFTANVQGDIVNQIRPIQLIR
jgi:FlgD Ig-like domain